MSTAQSPTSGWFRTVDKGVALIEMGRPDAALAILTPLLADSQANAAWVQGSIALAHLAAERFELAVRHAHASISLEPGRYEAYGLLAEAELSLGHAQKAADAAAQVVRLAPDAAWGYQLSALALIDLGRLEEAQAAARQAVVLAPEDASSHAALGHALRPTSMDDATRAYEQALALDPHSTSAQAGLAVLSALRVPKSRMTISAMVNLVVENPSAKELIFLLQAGVLRILWQAWLMVLPFWAAAVALVLLGAPPVVALAIALAIGPVLAGVAWYRLGPWRRAMPTGLRRFLSETWRTLPIVPGMVISTVVCWLSTLVMTVVNVVGPPSAVGSAVVASIVPGIVTWVILYKLSCVTETLLAPRGGPRHRTR